MPLLVWMLVWTTAFLGAQSPGSLPDGAYLSGQDFLQGKPTLALDQLAGDWYVSPEDEDARGRFFNRQTGQPVTPLVICFQGNCFKLDTEREAVDAAVYTPLLAYGAICVYRVRRQYEEVIPIKAYNPANGRPFLEGKVPRERTVQALMMWRPADDARTYLDRYSLREWTGVDEESLIRESDLIRRVQTYNNWQLDSLENQVNE